MPDKLIIKLFCEYLLLKSISSSIVIWVQLSNDSSSLGRWKGVIDSKFWFKDLILALISKVSLIKILFLFLIIKFEVLTKYKSGPSILWKIISWLLSFAIILNANS